MKRIEETGELEIGNRVRLLRKNDSGSWNEIGAAKIRGFAYGSDLTKLFANAEIYSDEGKLTGVNEILAINSKSFKIVRR